jgi:long-chain acyl-CoA synthetase
VRKTVVAEWVRARLAGGPGESGTASPLAPLVAAAGGEVPERLEAGATLATDLKLDSLGQLELLSALEERYQVDIDESAITPETTVGELQSLLSGRAVAAGAPYPYPRWAHRPPWTSVRGVLQALILLPIARAMCWVDVRGSERLRALEVPVLFVCNHISMVDAALVVFALPWRVRHRLAVAMQGEILRDWRHPPPGAPWHRRIWGPSLHAATAFLFGVYPLPQKSGFSRSFGFAGELVDRGFSLLVFPEGRRTPDGRMLPFLPGVGLMARGLGVPVVPLRIDGLFELKQRSRYLAWPGEVSITVGAPVRYEPGSDAAAITSDLERRVAALARERSG